MTVHLSSEAVERLLKRCLFTDDEDMASAVSVRGILHDYSFHPGRLAEAAPEIRTLLAELPDEFQANAGGGWTFLNACNDRHGNQWTGLHLVMEQLFCLGIAISAAKWLLDRDMWDAFPGGMPYVQVSADPVANLSPDARIGRAP